MKNLSVVGVFFLRDCVSEIVETLWDYTLHGSLYFRTSFDDLDQISRSQWHWNNESEIVCVCVRQVFILFEFCVIVT